MVQIFSKPFLDIMESSIPNKIVTIDDRDAPWVTPEVKTALLKNKNIYTKWVKNGRRPNEYLQVKQSQSETNHLVNSAKSSYINNLGKKICDPSTGAKVFHTAYKRLANKKKITNIPPLNENGIFTSNFKDKATIFNNYFALQCRPLDIDSTLPPFLLSLPPPYLISRYL